MTIGYGTQKLCGKEGIELFQYAYEVGYRLFDTALAYGNLHVIGEAIASLKCRKMIQLISKIARPDIEKWSTRACLEKILKTLRTDYLDVLLIHAPKGVRHEEVFTDMLRLQQEGKVIKCGVSNYTVKHLDGLSTKGIIPQATQVEIHPYLNEIEYVNYCLYRNIEVMAHSPLANGKIINEPKLIEMAKRLNCTVSQLVLSWLVARKLTPIVSSLKKTHIIDNFDIHADKIELNIMTQINSLNLNFRICNNPQWAEFS